MQEFYLRDYDVNLKFPDGMSEKRIKGIIERDYPEPDEKLVARFENPDTPASSLSKVDHERYLQARPDMTAGRFAGMAADAFTSTAGRLLTNLPEFLKTLAMSPLQMGVSARTLAEGFARGTYDTETMGRMAEGYLMSKVEGFGGRTNDEKENQYRRFLKVKELQNVRSKIDKGDKSAWNEYMEWAGANGAKIDPEKFSQGAAEFLGEFADPSLLIPGSKIGTAIAKTTGRVTGGAVSAAGNMMSAGGRRLSDLRSSATDAMGNLASKVDEASGGLGRYAVPGGVGAAIGVGALDLGTAGMGTLAVAGIPAAMEVAGGLLRNFGDAMKVNPTRSGGLARMALNSPDTAAGYLAGKLKFLDTPTSYAGRAASGAVTGVGIGAGIGLATGGVEGLAQGIGSGGAMGAFGGTMGRFVEGATGAAKRAAQDSDLVTWLESKSDEDRASLGRYKNRDDLIRAMDLEQVILGSTSEAEPIIRYGTDETVIGQDAQGKDITLKGGGGAYTQEGGRPVIHLNTNSDLRTLAHETFHAIARIDGFEVMVQRIKDQVGKLYRDQEIDKLINDYEKSGKLLVTDDTPGKSDRDKKFNSILEEIGAEYFANYIKGKDSNYLFKGNPIREAIQGITDRFVAGKLDRVYDTFKSDIFKTPIKESKALNRSIDDLVRARRRSKRNINLSVDTPVRVYSDFDLKDDAIFQELVDMGAARVTATGKREMIKSAAQVKKIEAERTRTMAKVLDSVDDTGGLIRDERGNYSGLRFSRKQIDALLASDAITGTLRKALEKIKEMPDDSGLMNVLYAAATAKTKKGLTRYRNLPLSNRDAILYNFIISPDQGTMRVKIVDKTLLDQRVAKEFANPETQKEFGSMEEMQRDLLTYLDALSSGQTPTAEVLGSAKKRDILGKVLRVRNQKNNILVPEGTKFNEGEKDFPWRDFRLDRIVQMTTRETKVNFSENAYNRAGINFSPKVSDDPLRVGTAKLGTKAKPKDTPQDSNISGALVSDAALKDHMSKMDYDHVPDRIKGIEDPYQKREAYIDWMVENLLALHDAFPADLREMATQWYDGAYLIANILAKKYEYLPQQVAGVAAVLSPQKDWFMNVAQAEQVIDIWVNHKDLRLDKKWLRDEVEYIIDAAVASVKQKRKVKKTDTPSAKTRKRNYNKRLDDQAKSDRREILERIYGKTVSELDTDPKLQGWAIRVLAQVIHGREYRVVSPDGKPMQISVKDDGTPQKNGWGSVKEINKAVSILKDGSLENISEQLGDKHKVRNFFNNIISPNSPFGDATIDTHAVAAAHLQPYGASATPVSHNFGSGVSVVNSPGVSGTYHVYLEAYKRAAEKRGLLPRQMQSITWEAVRLLYPSETRKGKKGIEKATNTWKSNTDEQARKTIVGGELPPPAWARSRDGGKPEGVPGGIPEDGATQDAGRGLLFRGGRHVYPGRVKRRGKAKQDPGPSLPAGIFSIDPAKSGRQFHRSIIKTAKDHPLGAAVEVKDLDFYKDTDTALFLSKDKKAGVAVTKDGDLVSVFKHPKSKADIVPLLEEAASVATTLDAFDVGGFLPNLYAKQGFKPIARVPWNDEYAPLGWPYDRAGKPDVVLMVRDPEGVLSDGFTDYNQSRDSVPMYDDYDVAMAKQKEAKAKVVKAGLGPEVRFSPPSMESLPSGEGPVLPKVEPPILQGPSANVVSLAKVKAEISKEKSPKVVDNTEIQEDMPVGLRLDIPTYERTIKAGQPVFPVAVHEKWKGKQAGKAGKVIGYTNIAAVKNPVFTVNEKAAESIKGGKAKSTIATVEGLYSKTREIPEDIDTWTQVGMNPRRHSYFYDRETGQPVIGGDVAISSGNTVFVKNPIYDSPGRFRFSPQRELDSLGMYSKAQEAIEGMQQKRGTGQQFLKAMEKAGVKSEEIEDIGLDTFLKDNPKTTKEEVLEFMQASQIEMIEVANDTGGDPGYVIIDHEHGNMFDDTAYTTFREAEEARNQGYESWVRDNDDHVITSAKDLPENTKKYTDYNFDDGEYVIKQLGNDVAFLDTDDGMVFDSKERAEKALKTWLNEEFKGRFWVEKSEGFGNTRHSEHVVPGAEPGTYTERLITLPASETLFVNKAHFDEANIVAHVRHNDRIGPDGEKILFLEEIQSDWHQAGRTKGYKHDNFRKLTDEEKTELTELEQEALLNWNAYRFFDSQRDYDKAIADGEQWTVQQQERLLELTRIDNQHRTSIQAAVANAPFKKSWPELAMKRMLKFAADEGYDAIAWTRGNTQNARWSIGDKVSGLEVIDLGDGTYELMARKPGEVEFREVITNLPKGDLPDYIGKELTQRAMDNMEGPVAGTYSAVLEGENLRVGGKGMRGFYDNKLPKLKVFKQTKDAKGKPLRVETKAISDDLEANYVALNDSVKKKISSQGMPRYSPEVKLNKTRDLNKRGGAIYTNERGDRAVQTSLRAGIRIYSTQGRRIGPVFKSIEKAERHLAKMGK